MAAILALLALILLFFGFFWDAVAIDSAAELDDGHNTGSGDAAVARCVTKSNSILTLLRGVKGAS